MNRRFPRLGRFLPLLLLLLLLVPRGEARAAEPVAHCKVRVILAKNGDGGVDSAIRDPLKRYLTKKLWSQIRRVSTSSTPAP